MGVIEPRIEIDSNADVAHALLLQHCRLAPTGVDVRMLYQRTSCGLQQEKSLTESL